MGAVQKLLSVFLIGVALVVAVHFVFNSFYREALGTVDVWGILDWPIALAIVIALVVNYQRKRALGRGSDGAITREYLEANVAMYGTAMLALWFFSNWFNFLNYGIEGESTTNQVVWAFVDVIIVLALGVTGRYLWSNTDS